MKNLYRITLSVLAVFFLAGCGSKNATTTVSCSYSQEQSMFTMTQDVEISIDKGTISNANLVNEIVYSDSYIGKYDETVLVDAMKNQFSNYKEVDVKPTSTGVIVTINLDTNEFAELSGLSTDDLKNIKEENIDELKSGMEKSGYTCK